MTVLSQMLCLFFCCILSTLHASEKTTQAFPPPAPISVPFGVRASIAPERPSATPSVATPIPPPTPISVPFGVRAGQVPERPAAAIDKPIAGTVAASLPVKVPISVQLGLAPEKSPVAAFIPVKPMPTPEPVSSSIGVKSQAINEADTGLPTKTSFQITSKPRDTSTNNPHSR